LCRSIASRKARKSTRAAEVSPGRPFRTSATEALQHSSNIFRPNENGHAVHHGWLCRFFKEIEHEVKDVIEDIESLLTGKPIPPHKQPQQSLRITAPSSGIYPLLFQAQFDPTETVGSVHVFDIVQTDQQSGKRGGIRVAIVVAP
jgi:hypothetical protein